MMGRQSGQLSVVVMDLSKLISDNHLLRRISQVISFNFIYEILDHTTLPIVVHRSILLVCLKCF